MNVWRDAEGTPHRRAAADCRIVSLVPSLTELLFALGLGPNIVGRTGFCIHPRDAVRDVIVRTRAGTDRISGRRLALRVAAGAAGSTQLYALSREYIEPALSHTRNLPRQLSA